jgi:hypothetical protein
LKRNIILRKLSKTNQRKLSKTKKQNVTAAAAV